MSTCLFCSIVAGQIPADIVQRTDHSVAFLDIDPQAPVHLLVVPVVHHDDAAAMAGDPETLGALMADAVAAAQAQGLAPEGESRGYRLVLNTGAGAGQSVFHTHVHVLGGRGFAWPPG